jgi:hypothetical protein
MDLLTILLSAIITWVVEKSADEVLCWLRNQRKGKKSDKYNSDNNNNQ